MNENLRPLERCVLSMRDEGLDLDEIGGRIKRSPEQVQRIIGWTELPLRRAAPRLSAQAFERRVLALRASGESYDQIGGSSGTAPTSSVAWKGWRTTALPWSSSPNFSTSTRRVLQTRLSVAPPTGVS